MVVRPTTEPVPKKWKRLLEAVPMDPWGTPYQYAYPGKRNPDGYDLYSFGADRREATMTFPGNKIVAVYTSLETGLALGVPGADIFQNRALSRPLPRPRAGGLGAIDMSARSAK